MGRDSGRITGRHVLLGLLGFFGLMLLANGIFLYYALATFDGSATSDAYRKGLRYNETLGQAAEQERRGWHDETRYDWRARRLEIAISAKSGEPVTGLSVIAHIGRPATAREDAVLRLEEVAPARYAARVVLDEGQWIVAAEATSADAPSQTLYRLKRRLWVSTRP